MGNDNKLKKVKEKSVVLELLNGAKDAGAEVFIWRLVGNSKYLGQVKIESIRKARNDFCLVPSDGQDRMVLELMNSQSHVDLYIPESALLLRCQIRQTDAPYRYYLQLPDFAAQIDRRNNLRLNIHENAEMKISFGKSTSGAKPLGQHFHKSCFDISVGGYSFLVSKMEEKFFEVGDTISDTSFKTREWSAKLNSEIVAIKEMEPDESNGLSYKAYRVCCRFQSIDKSSKAYIERFILERIKRELHAINV